LDFRGLLASRRFLVIASLPANDPRMARAAFAAGADAVKVHLNVRHRASGTSFGSWAREGPAIRRILAEARGAVGLMPGAETLPSRAQLSEIIGLGVSFIDIYEHDMPSWMLELKTTRMPAAAEGTTLKRVRALSRLGADCLEASIQPHQAYGQPLTAADLGKYRVLAKAFGKPVFVPSQKKLVPGDLEKLAKAGAAGVLLGAVCLGRTASGFSKGLRAFTHAV
jgi:hypothetical protein